MSDDDEERTGQAIDLIEGAEEREQEESTAISRAVAIQYDQEDEPVPRVTAHGKGFIAEQILEIAFANDIKVRSDADLIEILDKVEVDTPIPLEAFAAVAEILAYVYKANAGMKQRKAANMHKEAP